MGGCAPGSSEQIAAEMGIRPADVVRCQHSIVKKARRILLEAPELARGYETTEQPGRKEGRKEGD
jgi:hypothetical protein